MRRSGVLLTIGIVLGGVIAAGCGARPDVTPGAPPPTPAVRVQPGGDDPEQDQAIDVASRFPLPARGDSVQEVALDDSQCIGCHTDQEAVKALAVEPEEEEELSEGEG
ncbi:MAG: hypothetical protein U9R72_12645 [Chloroflexota bacterium]|nr:hypothetical protein [Chloroflexota bacterium]